jgi:hypothetical protein
MICVSTEKTSEWIMDRTSIQCSILVPARTASFQETGYAIERFKFPGDSGRKTFTAKSLEKLFNSENQMLVHLQNISIFPSSGYLPILVRLRQAWGEERPIEDSPGYIFESAEREDAISLFILAFQFFWDCFVLGDSGNVAIFISHDGFYDLICRDQVTLENMSREICNRK